MAWLRLRPGPGWLAGTAALVLFVLGVGASNAQALSYTAYVTNLSDGTVTPIATATNTAWGAVPVPSASTIAIAPGGSKAYVPQFYDGTMTPITVSTDTPDPPIRVGPNPLHGIAITPDGKTAYVSNDNFDTVTPVTLATGVAGAPIPVGADPLGVAITPDGKTAYVANGGAGSVTPIDLATNIPGAAIAAGPGAQSIAITPDGARAYVTSSLGTTVTTIDTATNTPGPTISLHSPPNGIAITSDGKTAYIATFDSVTPVSLATNSPGTPIPLSVNPYAIAITPDGTTAYLTSAQAGNVTPVTIATNTPGTPIATGAFARAIAITPTTRRLTRMSMSCSPTILLSGQSTTCEMTVSDVDSGTPSTPSGVIGLTGAPGDPTAACTLSGAAGSASCQATLTMATRGPVTVSGNFAGDARHTGSLAQISVSVSQRDTSTAIQCSPPSVLLGQSTTCIGIVTDTSAGTPVTPTGTLVFASDGAGRFSAGTCALVGSGAEASCQVTYTPTAVGSAQHTLTASYGGDTGHVGSSGQAAILVAARATSTSIDCVPTSILMGQSTTCTATVTDTDLGSPSTPTGKITFATNKSGKFSAGVCRLSGTAASAACQVSYTPTTLGNGQHTITGSYGGDTVHATSGGQTVAQVAVRGASTAISCQQNALAAGQSTNCTATVTDTSPGQPITPTGTVAVSGGRNDTIAGSPCTLSGTGAVASCQVTYTPTAVGTGRHTLGASYAGDRYHHASRGQTPITVTPSAGT